MQKRMPSNKRIVAYLEDDDWKLFLIALERYKIGQSELLKEIIHAWLFANKLQLEMKK